MIKSLPYLSNRGLPSLGVFEHNKIELSGFNNISKTLHFSLYRVGFAPTLSEKKHFIEVLNDSFNANNLAALLSQTAKSIDAEILNLSKQDYQPHGASVTVLIAEEPIQQNSAHHFYAYLGQTAVAHLDKSHIASHSYPDINPLGTVSTFRLDIDVSTCGLVSPLDSIEQIVSHCSWDVIKLDYLIRGFTRDAVGTKIFNDDSFDVLSHLTDSDFVSNYDVKYNQQHNNHHSLCLKKSYFNLDEYIFNDKSVSESLHDVKTTQKSIETEIDDIFQSCS